MLKCLIFLINVTLNIDHSKAEAKRLRLLGVEKVDKTIYNQNMTCRIFNFLLPKIICH